MAFSMLGALLPVMLVVVIGWAVAHNGWVKQSSVKDISNLVFMVLLPALLFRTMANVTISELDFYPIGIYFLASVIVFGGTVTFYGLQTASAARALAHVFSNVVMIGVPVVGLFYGEQGLITLFTLITVHSLVLLGSATIVFELASAREQSTSQPDASSSLLRTLGQALRKSILHPVPLPVVLGLMYAQTGWGLPGVLDKPLQMLGTAMGPMALLLVGMTLAYARIGHMWRQATCIALVKILIHPLVFFICALALGAQGLSIAVMLLCAALPVGANVLLFTQRYRIAQDEVLASMAISTVLALICIPIVMLVFSPFLV